MSPRATAAGGNVRILVLNPNTTEAVTHLMVEAGTAVAAAGTELVPDDGHAGPALSVEPGRGADRGWWPWR